MSFKDKCEEYFQKQDFYEILDVKRDATSAQVKKAYHKASLLVHPDRVPEEQKIDATEKFKIISKIYSVLGDEEKRHTYDETDAYDDEECGSVTDWLKIFRSMFQEVTVERIDAHKAKYINSEAEVRDIRKAYEHCKGNMTKMHDMIPFLDCANEDRIIAIVRKLVDDGELEEYDGFFNEPISKKKRRQVREESYRLTDAEQEALLKEQEEAMQIEEAHFMARMADIEARYCKPKTRAIKGRAGPTKGGKKKAKTGRVTKRR